eukprot:3648724-Pyramimonas_sp.AAC.1
MQVRLPGCLTRRVNRKLYASCSASLVLFNPTAAAVPSNVLSVLVVLFALAPLSSGLLARLRPHFPPPRLSAAPSAVPPCPPAAHHAHVALLSSLLSAPTINATG